MASKVLAPRLLPHVPQGEVLSLFLPLSPHLQDGDDSKNHPLVAMKIK